MERGTLAGTTLAGYELGELVARGGMGEVYRAHDPELSREVAVKVIAPELAGDPAFRERFLREIEVAATLEHPHVCPVYRGGEAAGGDLFIAMRLLTGGSLAEHVAREGPLAPDRVLELLSQLAAAIDAAHHRSLLHRDVKAENVLLDAEGNAYLVDFGLAGETADERTDDDGEPRPLEGTGAYLAPERCRGEPAQAASDLYALACLAYVLLSGDPPFPREHLAALLYAHMREEPPTLAGNGLARLDAVLRRALAKNPGERFASCSAFIDDLARALARAEPEQAWPVELPRPATRLVGRERELPELHALLGSSGVRLLTLTGPGGTGKTRLALHAAAEAATSFRDGVRWLALAPLADPAHVLSALGHVLSVSEQPGASLRDTLAEALAGKDLLLVLDNAEHLLPEVADVVAFLRDLAEGPTLLVTSRERLDLQAEQLYPVPALAETEGIELFCERAKLADPGFDHQDASIPELCARLDSLPLALELAAARSDLYSPGELLRALSGRLELLTGSREHDPRHRTLAATIAWSYELLSPHEQRSFRALSVFAGGCNADAAAEVAGADLPLLHSLLGKSLLRTREAASGRRYWMLETIRDYAAAMLTGEGERDDAERRHTAAFVRQSEQTSEWGRSRRRELLDLIEADYDNIRLVLRRAVRDCDAEAAQHMVVLTAPYWWTRGSPNEGDELITSVLALPLGEGLARHGRVLDTASAMATLRGDFDRAAELGGEAVRVLEEAGDLQSLGVALSNLGGSFAFQPDRLDESVDHLRRAIDVFRSLGQLERLASAMLNLANAYLGLYRYEDAEATYREARDIAEACGDARWVASATLGVGECAYWSGDLATARVTLLAAAEDGAALHDYAIVVNALDPLAIVASRSGAHEEALLVRVAVDAAASRLGHALDPLYEDARNAAADASRETLGVAAAEVEARAASLALDDVLAVVRQGSERSAAKPARRA